MLNLVKRLLPKPPSKIDAEEILKDAPRYPKYLALSISAIISLLLLLPLLIDNSNLKTDLETKISAKIKASVSINKVDVTLLPSPKIIMNDVTVENYINNGNIYYLNAKAVEIKTGFLAVLLKRFDLKELNFYNGNIKSYNQSSTQEQGRTISVDALNKITNSNFSSNQGSSFSLFSLNGIENQSLDFSAIPKINTHNINLTINDRFGHAKEFDQINLAIANNQHEISAKGYFLTGGTVNNIEFISSLKKNTASDSSKLFINSLNLELKVVGAFNLDSDIDLTKNGSLYTTLLGSKFNGKVSGEVKNLKGFYHDYFSDSDLLYTKISPAAESINFNAAISNQQNDISVSNLTINSSTINGNGNAEINTSAPKTKIAIDFSFDDLDLDSLWLSDSFYTNNSLSGSLQDDDKKLIYDLNLNNQQSTINLGSPLSGTNSSDPNLSLDLKITIAAKSAKYLGAKFNNINLLATSYDQSSILINPVTFNIGSSNGKIIGILKKTDDLKFIGQINLDGPQFQDLITNFKIESQNLRYDRLNHYILHSNLFVTPNSTTFDNISFVLNDTNEFLGNITIDNSKKTSSITTTLKVGNFNVDDYFLISGQNSYLSSGLLINKVFWLNNLNAHHQLNLSFDNLTYKNELFHNQVTNAELGQGYLAINIVSLKSDNTDLNATIALDIRGSSPLILINLIANKFHYQTPQINNQISNISGQVNTGTINNNKQNNFADQFFALPSLTGFDGKVNFDINDLTLDQMTAKNVKIAGLLKDGNLNFSNFSGEIIGGKIEFTGSAIIRNEKMINGNIALNDVNLRPLLSGLFGLNNIDGVSNVSASFRASASNRSDFIRDIESNVKFGVRSLEIDGYGLQDLVVALFNPVDNLDALNKPEAILFNTNAKTIFDKATGEIDISKNDANKLHVDISSLAVNAVISGSLNLVQQDTNLNANIIFLTGSKAKQIPLNIASTISGNISNCSQITNLDQVNQYIQILKTNIDQNNTPANNTTPSPPSQNPTAIQNDDPRNTSSPNQLMPANSNVNP